MCMISRMWWLERCMTVSMLSFLLFMMIRRVLLFLVRMINVTMISCWPLAIIILRFFKCFVIVVPVASVAITCCLFLLLLFLFFKSCCMFNVLPHLGRVGFDIVGTEQGEIYRAKGFQLVDVCLPSLDGIEGGQPGKTIRIKLACLEATLVQNYNRPTERLTPRAEV